MTPAADMQRCLAGRGCDSRVFRVENKLDVVGRDGNIVDLQTEEDGVNLSTLLHASPHATASGCACLKGHCEHRVMQAG